jgi:potassium-transporting ATPase KdpC subunit
MTETKRNNDPSAKPAHESAGSYLGHLWASIAMTVTLGIICCGAYPLIVYLIAQTVFPNQANGSLVKKDGTYTTKDEEAVGSALLGQNFSLPQYFTPRPSSAGSGYDPTSSGSSNLGPLSDKLINGLTQAAATQPTTAPVASTTPAAATSVAATAPASTQPAETLAFDGIRLRTIHYALNNNISFKLYNLSPDGSKVEVPISKFEDSSANPIDTALVDAFPHPENDAPDRVVLVAGDFHKPDGTPVMIPADAVTGSGSGLDPHITPDNAELQAPRVAAARNISVDKVTELIAEHTDAPSLGIFGDPGVNVLMLNLALDNKYPVPAAPTTAPASH